MLARGKARLASGQQTLAQAKHTYNGFKPAILAAAVLPITAGALMVAGNQVAKGKISHGEQLVAEGRKKIEVGEAQLAQGKLELNNGIEQLKLANQVRIACGALAVIFSLLLAFFLFQWRNSFKR